MRGYNLHSETDIMKELYLLPVFEAEKAQVEHVNSKNELEAAFLINLTFIFEA